MVSDLLDRHPLVGRTREEVVALLGSPTRTDKWDEWQLVYVLGPTSGFPVDHEWLLLRLNNRGVVTGYQVTSD